MKKRVKLGCILPLAGFESLHARSQLLAIRLACEEAQKEEELPYHLELVERDDAFSGERAKEIAKELSADPEVLGVVGPMNTDTNLIAAPIFHEAGLVHIATAASNADLTKKGWKTFFRVVPNDIFHYHDAAKFAVEYLKAHKISVVNDGSNFTRPMAEGFRDEAQKLGAEIPAFIGVERGKDDYLDAAKELAKTNQELIFFVVIEQVAAIIAKQLRELGVMVPFFATDGLKPFPYFATPGYDVVGPYYTNVCADPEVQEKAGAMVERYIKRFDEKPTVYTAEGYDAARILISAFGDGNRSRKEVLEAVRDTNEYPGVSSTITFNEEGDLSNPAIGIYKVEDGKELSFLGFTKDILKD